MADPSPPAAPSQPAHPSTPARAANVDDLRAIEQKANHKQEGEVKRFHGPDEGEAPHVTGPVQEPKLPWVRPEFTSPAKLKTALGPTEGPERPTPAAPARPVTPTPTGPSPVATSAGPSPSATAELAARLQQAYPRMTSPECVALAQAMGGVGNVHEWRRGASIQDTRPAVGTPVSTFGWHGDSPTYAYGGSGTRGIGRDHAGIVAGYTANGVWLLNQWAGQSPTYTFYAWGGQGEHGGQNYYTINSRGQPLGAPGLASHGMLSRQAAIGRGGGLHRRPLPGTPFAARAAPGAPMASMVLSGASSEGPSFGSISGSASARGGDAPLSIRYRSSVVVRVA